MKSFKAITKITRPKLSGIAPRERLFAQLDSYQSSPMLWVTAPGGSGKTTLAGSYLDSRQLPTLWYQIDMGDGDLAGFFYYMGLAAKKAAPRYKKPLPLLTPEYLMGLPVFTRRFFESLFQRLPENTVLIFDNYQDVPDDSGFHDVFAHVLDTIPDGIRVMVLSRTGPPAQFARQQANRRIARMGWDDIRFTPEESADLLTRHGHSKPADALFDELYRRTSGWAAGLVLLTAQADLTDPIPKTQVNLTSREVFAYFASEIFERSAPEIQNLLLKTAFLDKIDPVTAEQLTGNSSAGCILEKLHRDHYFTQLYDSGYQYHPLFREFLVSRVTAMLQPSELLVLMKETARILEDSGQVEEAVRLYCDAAHWQKVERLILAYVQTMIMQGRNKTVEQWIYLIPDALRLQNPWLVFWLGSCRIQSSPAAATPLFEQAYELFTASGDVIGSLLSCSLIIDSIVFSWNYYIRMAKWIPILQSLLDENRESLSDEILTQVTVSLFASILICQPFRHDLDQRFEAALTLIRKSGNPAAKIHGITILTLSCYWHGDMETLRILSHELTCFCDDSAQPPLMQIMALWNQAYCGFILEPGLKVSTKLIENAIKVGEASGVHVWDPILCSFSIHSAIANANYTQAHELLAKLHESVRPEISDSQVQYHYMMAWLLVNKGDVSQAAAHGETALRIAGETGYYFIELLCTLEMVWIEATRCNFERATVFLQRAKRMVDNTRSTAFRFTYLLAEAFMAINKSGSEAGLVYLKEALIVGRTHDFSALVWWWQPDVMALLCSHALEDGIETEYVRKLITWRQLAPPAAQPVSEAWPWPVKINTLGRFEVQVNGQTLDLSGKRKILELLKALVALGGNEVKESRINDLLWPECDGDDANNTFKVNLSRLRKLLPADTILLQEGAYTLNRKLVRTDLWAFDQTYDAATDLWRMSRKQGGNGSSVKSCSGEALILTQKGLVLYQGDFLPGDASLAWTVSQRERMRTRFLLMIVLAGQHHEEKGRWKSAAGLYRQGIETDTLQEEFYQRLIICLQHLGQRSEALSVYECCRAELSTHLKIGPSPKTEALHAEFRK